MSETEAPVSTRNLRLVAPSLAATSRRGGLAGAQAARPVSLLNSLERMIEMMVLMQAEY